MALLRVSTHVENGMLELRLNNAVIAVNTDSSETSIDDVEREHVLQWFIHGRPESTYSITISSPRKAELQLIRVLGDSGKDFGGFNFSL